MQQKKLAKLILRCKFGDLPAVDQRVCGLGTGQAVWGSAPHWVSARVHRISEGTCYRTEAETSARPWFNISLGFIHCVFHWDMIRSDDQCGCHSEPLLRTRVHQEKRFFKAKHTVPWAILRKERVFHGCVWYLCPDLCGLNELRASPGVSE